MDIKRIVMAGGVLATAGAIGFVMQNGESAKARYAGAPVPDISGTQSDPMEVTDIKLTSATSKPIVSEAVATKPTTKPMSESVAEAIEAPAQEIDEPVVRTAALGDIALKTTSAAEIEEPEIAGPASLCDISMNAVPSAAAMVDVSLKADCYPNERVTFHHNGMMFTHATDRDGNLDLSIPALSENAVIIVAFANGEGALANAKVPSLADYDRMVVQSKAKSNLHINAFEFGANFREDGHVNVKSERTIEHAEQGLGGFITVLGDKAQGEALVAEVYTFPTNTSQAQGDVHVSVDANVTIANCGLRIEAQTLEVSRAGKMKVQDLSLPIPGCDAVGDFLVLQNLIQDLKVARN
ncbi:hypothetical protein LY10_01249 [Planktotalea frisia]|jgi:hypothetical protein|uniref:Translocase n=1 Tax=Planktotalea frisia TaxID=696762 RepID=A0A1L9P094_9RHOB|nr:hypothetical protein [Planktotalea frisia]OJI94938.1 hypothetical protein PFRI_08390 [Planktotalea frisia]PZX31409.1 hypothetical protein LY10_01249 [Planktotalea frisia]